MDARAYALPALAMALLTFAVWLRLFFTRIPEMKRERIHPQSIALSAQAGATSTTSAIVTAKRPVTTGTGWEPYAGQITYVDWMAVG